MLNKIFPKNLNNDYQGYVLAKWVFVVIVLLTIVRSLLHIGLPDSGAQSIATIPLDTFSQNAAASVILMMALWGSSQLMMALVYVVVLWRYRALIPFMYILIFLEYSMRMMLMHVKPIQITGTAPGHVGDYVMVPLALVMFLLSVCKNK